jgi:hypothetical protein
MRHTLKAVFEHRSDAQQVLDELLASGYPRADIALSDIATTGPADDEGHATGLGASIRHAAARLLGTLHHKDAETHRHIVTLTTESDPAAARAAGIIGNHHPAGLEDIHDERDPGDRRADVAGAGTGSATMRRRYPPGTAPGSLQHRPHEDSHYFGNAGLHRTMEHTGRRGGDRAPPPGHGAGPGPRRRRACRGQQHRPGLGRGGARPEERLGKQARRQYGGGVGQGQDGPAPWLGTGKALTATVRARDHPS